MIGTQTKQISDFCWVELMTSDIQAAKKFYGALFSWQADAEPMPDGQDYVMMQLDGMDVGGGFQLTPEMREAGLPLCWASYILVDDVNAIASKALSLGGVVRREPFDVMECGRMAVIEDPTGAVFSLWQKLVKGPSEQPSDKTPGMFSWFELSTDDLAKAQDFYCQLFDWTAEEKTITDKQYISFLNHGRPMAGMMEKTPECPCYWGAYFTTADLKASVVLAKELNAEVVLEPLAIPDVGEIAILKDPQGVHVSLFQFA